MRVLGYIRVSTEEQANDGKSLGIQTLQIKKYCDVHGHELVSVIHDKGVSASIELGKRAGGSRLLQHLERGTADAVIIQRIDRMFRMTIDGLITARWFLRRGLDVVAVTESIELATPDGWLTFTIKLATAEYERNKIAQRSREVCEALKQQNKQWGHVPYGLRVDNTADKNLYRDPVTWPTRVLIYGLIMERGMSYRNAAKHLRAQGIVAPRGGALWSVSTVCGLVKTFHEHSLKPTWADENEAVVSVQPTVLKTA